MLTSEMIKAKARELGASVCGIGRVYDEPDAQRDPKQILLCAATKMNNADAVRQAIAGGVECCGENRVQE